MRTKRVAMLMLLTAPLVLVIAILLDGLTDNTTGSDVGIVLGSKVMPDGTPSARLRARLDKADELFQLGKFKYVIVSGGTGNKGRSEARVVADYLAGQKRCRARPSSSMNMGIPRRPRHKTAQPS